MTSTTELYSRTNLDVNTFMICYTVSRNDLDTIMIQLKKSTQKFQKPHGLETPDWWPENINELKIYKFRPDTSIWTFSIDNDNRIIYSWGKH